jgi:hypothetical protein
MGEIGKSQSIEDQKSRSIPREKKRNVQPPFLSMEVTVKPWENIGSSWKQEQEQNERNGEKGGKGF